MGLLMNQIKWQQTDWLLVCLAALIAIDVTAMSIRNGWNYQFHLCPDTFICLIIHSRISTRTSNLASYRSSPQPLSHCLILRYHNAVFVATLNRLGRSLCSSIIVYRICQELQAKRHFLLCWMLPPGIINSICTTALLF